MNRYIFYGLLIFLRQIYISNIKLLTDFFVYVVTNFLVYIVADLLTEIWVYVNQFQFRRVYINSKFGLFLG